MPDVLTQLTFLPAALAVLLTLIPRKFEKAIYSSAMIVLGLVLGLSIRLYLEFDPTQAGMQFVRSVAWLPSFGIFYSVGIDGISLVLILLTTLLTAISLFATFDSIRERRKEFIVSLLLLETAMLGTFVAQDLFLFYVFWEAMLIPMYILIGVFGGPRRVYATLKFFLYTMAGSVLMLVAILGLYVAHQKEFGFASTAFQDLYKASIPFETQVWMFAAFALAFAIKIPLFPLHTWLPDAHVEAPTAGSVILAGVLLKMGGYGLLRLGLPLFPEGAQFCAPFLAGLAVIGIVYGAAVALVQEDIKRLVAYSSVSHMGFVVLGMASMTSLGIAGSVFQMIAHGLSTGALFLLVGMLYDRRHTRNMADYGGLAKVTPRLAVAFFIITLASIGLPGMCGFVGEFLILTGSFHALSLIHPAWFVGISVTGIVLGAAYMLVMYERVFWGEVKFEENRSLRDLSWTEGLSLAVPLILVIWLGIQPNRVLHYISPAVKTIVSRSAVIPYARSQASMESKVAERTSE